MTAPDADDYGPSWYAATRGEPPEMRVLPGPLDVDVCIIGGSLAGLAMAEALARRDWSVALLDSGRIGALAARGSGLVTPGFCEPVERIIDRVGIETAQALWRLTVQAIGHIRGSLAGFDGAALSPGEGHLAVARADRQTAVRRRADLIASAFATRAEFWPTDQVRTLLKSRRLHQGVCYADAFHIHPLNYALALAGAVRRAGGRVYEETPVSAIDLGHVRRRVVTPHGTLRARHIVLAGDDDMAALYPPLRDMTMTLACPTGIMAPSDDRLARAFGYAGTVTTGGAGGAHRIVAGGKLLWSSDLTTRRTPPWRFESQLRQEIGYIYPALADAPMEMAWYGQADYAVHRMPLVGELRPGLWLAGAFAHHGVAPCVMAGRLLARAIDRGDDRWRLFNAYGLVRTGGEAGRILVAAAIGVGHLRRRLRDLVSKPPSLMLPEEKVPRPGMRIPPLRRVSILPPREPQVFRLIPSPPKGRRIVGGKVIGGKIVGGKIVGGKIGGGNKAAARQAVARQAVGGRNATGASLPDGGTAVAQRGTPVAGDAGIVPTPDVEAVAAEAVGGVAGLEPAGERPAIEAAAGEQPVAMEPVAIEPVAIEPVAIEPASMEPASKEPAGEESNGKETSGKETSGKELAEAGADTRVSGSPGAP